jgi:catechol 2,3-dioxygenase-like lactoylglutathione lyase family enzyme
MSNFIQITPFMHVRELEPAVAFFRDILGFKEYIHVSDYAYLEREACGIRIWAHPDPTDAPPGNRSFRYYIDVRDVDALYAELKPKLDTLLTRDVHGPADKTYGQRELLILAPDGNLVCFGQAIHPMPTSGATASSHSSAS